MGNRYYMESELLHNLIFAVKCSGGLREFCRRHKLDAGNVSNVMNLRRPMQKSIANALGFKPETVYVLRQQEQHYEE